MIPIRVLKINFELLGGNEKRDYRALSSVTEISQLSNLSMAGIILLFSATDDISSSLFLITIVLLCIQTSTFLETEKALFLIAPAPTSPPHHQPTHPSA